MMNDEPFISKSQISLLVVAALLLFGLYIHDNISNLIYKFVLYGALVLLLYIYMGIIRIRENECLLSTKISEERARLCKAKSSRPIKEVFQRLYEPSFVSFAIIATITGLLNLPSHISRFGYLKMLAFDSSNHFQNLIAIHAGIGTIIFALLIFVAESLRADENKDEARVLLKESWLYPLAVAEIITFFNFLWGDLNVLSIVPIFLVGLLAIYSLSKLIYVLLNVRVLYEKRLELLRDRVKKSVRIAIDERLGNNYLMSQLGENKIGENKIELTYTPFSERDDENYHFFNATKEGVITDINLCKLDRIAKLLEQEANKNGQSFYENKPRPPEELAGPNDTQAQSTKTPYAKANKYYFGLSKKYHDRVERDYETLIRVHKSILKNTDAKKEIDRLVEETFKIGEQDKYSEQIRLELSRLKGQFIEAINERRLDKIENFRQMYWGLADSFQELMSECGGGYSYEQAKKEIGNIFEGWKEVQQLDDDLRELLIKSTQTHDEETIREVAYIPVVIATRAIRLQDHFLFQKFLTFIPYLRHLGYKEPDKNVRRFIHNKSVTWLKEVAEFYVEPKLKESKDEAMIKEYSNFATHIILIFQSLLKTSFDNDDIKTIEEICSVLNRLYRHFDPSRGYPNAEHFEWELKRATTDEERAKIESKLKVQKALEESEQTIQLRKKQLFFGFASWLFQVYRSDKSKKQAFLALKKNLPTKLDDLTQVFITSRKFETEDFFGWQWWDVIPDGEVRMLDFHSKLDYLYLILALEHIPGSQDQLEKVSLPNDRDLSFLIKENGDLQKKLSEIETNYSTAWTEFITQANISKASLLRELFDKTQKEYEIDEKEYIKTASISNKKVDEFYNLFSKGFDSHATLRKLFARFKRLTDLSKTEELKSEIDLIGYNQIDMKEGFIEDWYVHYVGWGEQYGEGFARSENQMVFEKIADNLSETKEIEKEEIILQITECLKQKKMSNPVIAGSFVNHFELQHLRASDQYVPRWDRRYGSTDFDDLPFYMGYLKYDDLKVPILRVFSKKPGLTKTLIVFSAKDIGKWIQYPPIKNLNDKDGQRGIFLYRIYDLNVANEQRNKILQQNPEWLHEHTKPEDYLRGKALINIFEKFEFNILDKNAGCRFVITDAGENNEIED